MTQPCPATKTMAYHWKKLSLISGFLAFVTHGSGGRMTRPRRKTSQNNCRQDKQNPCEFIQRGGFPKGEKPNQRRNNRFYSCQNGSLSRISMR